MPGAEWFPDARLNFAKNLLRRRGNTPAVLFRREDGLRRVVSHDELHAHCSQVVQALRAVGIRPGDRIAGLLPNAPEAVAAALGTAAVGAIWASCSPDFGVPAAVDRFGQVAPRVLIAADAYFYNGKRHDILDRVREIADLLPSVEHVIVVPYVDADAPIGRIRASTSWPDFLAPYPPGEIQFEELPFSHPLYVLFTSGTTGAPKCIVHGAGGTLLKHLSEHQLHSDMRPGDRALYFTTCGWTMWNWLLTALASEATLALVDGSPLYPTPAALFDYADEVGITFFGVSANYIDTVRKSGLRPRETHKLDTVRSITSTGSPLLDENFDYVYSHIKPDVHLASICGGTDIIGAFVGGDPTGPVWRGEIQVPLLGMAVEVFDDHGRPVPETKGELVCTAPFPSMPIGFWNDEGQARFLGSYFTKFPNVWAHGDLVEMTAHGGFIVYGRADAVLNPGGVRIGTSEIYRPVEQIEEVAESVAVGQRWKGGERIVLFVKLRDSLRLDERLREKIRERTRRAATPRHVPARIVQVADIPRTKTGKVVELAVREIIHDQEVKNLESLANPEVLEFFRNLPELTV
jgi:acetoacetyl-CoA synthetase